MKKDKKTKNTQQKIPGQYSKMGAFWNEIWIVMFPLMVYYLMTVAVLYTAQGILGDSDEQYMFCQSVVAVVTIPVMYFGFYRVDLKLFGPAVCAVYARKRLNHLPAVHQLLIDLFMTIVITLLVGTGLNNLIAMSPMAAISTGYAEVNSGFYGSTMAIELLASGLLTPILEEMVYRGIVYARVRRMTGLTSAVLFTSVFFAVLHFNLVQGVYSLLMGMMFCLLLEKTGRLAAPIAGHMAINVLAILREETGILSGTQTGSASAWIFTLAVLAAGILVLAIFVFPVFDQKKGSKYFK